MNKLKTRTRTRPVQESKKVPQLRTQLEAYKKQLVELQLKASEQDKQLDKVSHWSI